MTIAIVLLAIVVVFAISDVQDYRRGTLKRVVVAQRVERCPACRRWFDDHPRDLSECAREVLSPDHAA